MLQFLTKNLLPQKVPLTHKIIRKCEENRTNPEYWECNTFEDFELTTWFFENFADCIDFNAITSKRNDVRIPEDILLKFSFDVNWKNYLSNRCISDCLIYKLVRDRLPSECDSLNELYQYEHVDFLPLLTLIMTKQSISEDLINKIAPIMDWTTAQLTQSFSENFIREWQNTLSWSVISEKQKLSEEFLVEFIDKVDLYWLERNKNVPKDVFERIKLLKGIL
jgi:hypothetical protein